MNICQIFDKLNRKFRRRMLGTMWIKKSLMALAHERVEMGEVGQLQEAFASYLRLPGRSKKGSALADHRLDIQADLQIVVPAYKVEKYIGRCLDSVLRQTTKYKIMVTVVNDGSPDKTREILRKYESDARVTVIDQENKGLSVARNTAIDTIKGRYVTFLDSDDELHPGSIDVWLDTAYRENADLVVGGYTTFSDSHWPQSTVVHPYEVIDHWCRVVHGYPWGIAIKADRMQHLCFPEGYWFEDTMYAFLLYPTSNKCVTIPDIVYHYRSNPYGISATSAGNPKVIDTLLVTMQLLADGEKLGIKPDAPLYNVFLYQVSQNYNRIHSLHDSSIDRLVFRMSCYLRERYFSAWRTSDKRLQLIEQSLLSCDFGKYRYACIL